MPDEPELYSILEKNRLEIPNERCHYVNKRPFVQMRKQNMFVQIVPGDLAYSENRFKPL